MICNWAQNKSKASLIGLEDISFEIEDLKIICGYVKLIPQQGL